MATDINNDAELIKILQSILEQVIEKVAKRVEFSLSTYIMRDVYHSHGVNAVYHDGSRTPTYEFLNAWKFTPTVKSGLLNLTKELYYDWNSMRFDGDSWLHGSNIEGWGDSRQYLAQILNGDTQLSSLWMTRQRKDYWDNFIEDLLDKKKLDNWFSEEFKKFGIRRS